MRILFAPICLVINMAKYNELGVPGALQYNGVISESWIRDLRSSARKIKVFDEISRLDPVGGAMLQTTRMFLQGARLHVKEGGDTSADKDKAAFLERNLHNMSKSFEDVIGDIVYFLVYGWMDMEIVYKKGDEGGVEWRKWAPRHPVTLDRWEFDESGGLSGMWQSWQGKEVFIPIEKLLHFTTTGAGKNNVEGISCFESSYTSWFFVKNLSILEAVVCERLSGTPTVTLPENAETDEGSADVIRAKRVARNIKLGDDMGLTLPYGWGFEYKMPAHGPAISIGEVIKRHQEDEARTMMMDFIMIGGSGGSYAMIKDKSSLYIIALNTYLNKIAAVINRHAVTRLFELNNMPETDALPEVYFDKISKIDVGDFATIISSLFNAGAITYNMETENQVRRMIGIEQIDEPGLLLKPNLPAQQSPGEPPDGKEADEVKLPAEQDVEMSEFANSYTAGSAGAFTASVAQEVLRIYERELGALPEDLAGKDEDEWADLIDVYMDKFLDEVKGSLAEGMIAAWIKFVGDRPPLEGYKAIVDELMFQAHYLDTNLRKSLSVAIIDKLRELGGNSKDIIVDAIRGVMASFTYRLRMYASSSYKIFGNHATAWRAKLRINNVFPRNKVQMDWKIGRIYSDGVLAKNFTENDERVCSECEELEDLGWTDPKNIKPIGQRLCGGSDRCYITYKYHGRNF